MYKRILLLLLLFSTYCTIAKAQYVVKVKSPKDSSLNMGMLTVFYTLQIPQADMAKRFGINSNIGGSYTYKTKSNYIVGVEGAFLFGNEIKENDILSNISTNRGVIIKPDGTVMEPRLFERAFNFHVKAGKLVPVFGRNKNSGFVATAGLGFFQHKIRIETPGNAAPQLNESYKKGYDRLSNGLSLHEFVGYMHINTRQRLNFYGGVDFMQAFTQSRRDFDFYTQRKDDLKRKDFLYGFKIGIIVPINRRAPKDFYFN